MPYPTRRDAVCFFVLVLSVPFQYFLGNYTGSTEQTRTFAVNELLTEFRDLGDKWLSFTHWSTWCMDLVSQWFLIKPNDSESLADDGESPAVEVMQYKQKEGHFGTSPDVRFPRPLEVKYRIGQVFQHRTEGYRGVIIGWDRTARAPEDWLQHMHRGHPDWKSKPNYAALVDTRDRTIPQMTYVVEDNIVIVRNTKVMHPAVDDYFESWDGAQYIPRPWLRHMYPQD